MLKTINSSIDILTGMGGGQTRLCRRSRMRVVFNGGIVVASLAVALGKVQIPYVSEKVSQFIGGIGTAIGGYFTYKSIMRAKSYCIIAAKRTAKLGRPD